MDVVDTLHGRAESFTRSIQPCLGEEYTIETDRHGAAENILGTCYNVSYQYAQRKLTRGNKRTEY